MTYVWLTWLADELRAEGCKVKEYDGWKTRGRPSSTGAFDPYGVLQHHTGTKTSYDNPAPTLATCINGRSDLPGPLCQVMIGYDGTCHVIAAGRANHGGECNGNGPTSSGDANAQLVGFEIDYSGSQAVSPEQGDAAVRAAAAVLRRFGRDASYCRGHKETSTTGKWDPGRHGSNDPAYDMGAVRGYIQDRLDTGEDDAMRYASFGGPAIGADPNGSWKTVKLTDERADPDGMHFGEAGAMHLGHANFVAMLALAGNRHTVAATLLVRWLECDDATDETVSSSIAHEYVLSDDTTDLRDTYLDVCSKGHYVKAQVQAKGGRVDVDGVSVKVIYWPR